MNLPLAQHFWIDIRWLNRLTLVVGKIHVSNSRWNPPYLNRNGCSDMVEKEFRWRCHSAFGGITVSLTKQLQSSILVGRMWPSGQQSTKKLFCFSGSSTMTDQCAIAFEIFWLHVRLKNWRTVQCSLLKLSGCRYTKLQFGILAEVDVFANQYQKFSCKVYIISVFSVSQSSCGFLSNLFELRPPKPNTDKLPLLMIEIQIESQIQKVDFSSPKFMPICESRPRLSSDSWWDKMHSPHQIHSFYPAFCGQINFPTN